MNLVLISIFSFVLLLWVGEIEACKTQAACTLLSKAECLTGNYWDNYRLGTNGKFF